MSVVVPPTAGVGSRDRTLVSTAARNHQHHIYTCMHVSAASSVPKTIRVPVASLTSNQQHDCMRLAKHRPRSLLPHTKAHPEVGLAAPHNLPQHPFSWNKDQHSISKQTTASTPLITEFWWWKVPCGLFACAVQHYTAHAS